MLEQIVGAVLTSDVFLRRIAQNLPKAALGGRICYSSKSIEEIIREDERLSSKENLSDYLLRLAERKHYSVFEHSFIEFTKEELGEILLNGEGEINLRDLVQSLTPELADLLNFIGASYSQGLPISKLKGPSDREIRAVGELAYLALLRHFPVLPRKEERGEVKVALNMRHLLEYLDKTLRFKSDTISEFLKEEVFSKIKVEPRELLPYKIVEPKGRYSFRVIFIGEEQTEDKTCFVIEGCSRTLTHQLVRHRLYASYSQRSLRYTKVKGEEDFVYPLLDYVEGNLESIDALYKDSYLSSLSNYQALLELGVRKEDARFVIPSGVKTTIMVTMLYDGLDNFLKERTHSHAQWEIRKVAEIVKEEILT